MTNSSKQGFRIASPADIKAQADIMCRAILSSESGMEMVLDMLYATVLNKIHFSRTLAILVGEISRRLPVEVGDEFLKRITAEVVDIFRQYYNVVSVFSRIYSTRDKRTYIFLGPCVMQVAEYLQYKYQTSRCRLCIHWRPF